MALALLFMTVFEVSASARDRSTGFTVNGTTVSVDNPGEGKDISINLDNALNYAKENATKKAPITVKAPKGKFLLGETGLHIFSNTTLDMTDCHLVSTYTIIKDEEEAGEAGDEESDGGAKIGEKAYFGMIIAGVSSDVIKVKDKNGVEHAQYNSSEYCAGYEGFENITIKGGVFESVKENTHTIIRLYHANNVLIDGVTVTGGGCLHQIEVAALKDFTVKDCTFKDYGAYDDKDADSDKRENQEALQLDVAVSKRKFMGIYQDGTMMKNVTVTGCTFKNVPRGVGTHSMLLGAYHENIKINNNTFEDVADECVIALTYRDCEIKNNVIKNCGSGILVQYFKPRTVSIDTTIQEGKVAYKADFVHDAKTEVSGNTIITKQTSKSLYEEMGIKLYGLNLTAAKKDALGKTIAASDYYISGVSIHDNNITTSGYGLHLMDARDVPVTNNTIKSSCVTGIHVADGSKLGDITGNKITNFSGEAGIAVIKNSSAGAIKDNVVEIDGKSSSFVPQGIKISAKSTVGSITGNTISDVDPSRTNMGIGILIYNKSKVNGEVSENKITETSSFGISISTNSTVTGLLNKNKVTDTKASSIFVFSGSTVKGITNNTINKSGAYGIQVSTKCNVKGNISGNTTGTSTKTSGIFIKQTTVTGSVSKNTIKKSKEHGIFLTDSAIVKKGIDNNTIVSPKLKGIFLQRKSSAKTIRGNKISGVSSHCINISSLTNAMTISKNTLSGGKEHVIIIQPDTKKYKISISGNKITADKTHAGIRVMKGGKVNMKKNTIKTAYRGIWYEAGVKATVSGNKFKGKAGTTIYSAGKEIKQK